MRWADCPGADFQGFGPLALMLPYVTGQSILTISFNRLGMDSPSEADLFTRAGSGPSNRPGSTEPTVAPRHDTRYGGKANSKFSSARRAASAADVPHA